MKRRNREINIFNVSVLDMFASALGAFMFLSVITLPFFPNTGTVPKDAAEMKKELDETKKELTEEKSTAKIAFPAMDIVVALDTTRSMENQVDGLRNEIVQLADLIMKLSPDAAMGIVDFRDRCEPRGAVRSQPIVKLTHESLGTLQAFADTMKADSDSCNQDYEEALDQALNTALAFKWRSTSKSKVIIVISDNGAYATKVESTLAAARDFHAQPGKNQVATVFVPTPKDAHGKGYLEQLAKAGGGKFVTGGGSFTATILLALSE